jgi:3-methyladenine DNA glycosylase AlkD
VLVQTTLDALHALADEERATFAYGYHATAETILGVSTPRWRGVAKALTKELKGATDQAPLVDRLLASGVFEMRLTAYHLCRYHKATWAALDEDRVTMLKEGLDNWVTVDTFGCHLSGRLWLKDRFSDATVLDWTKSEDRWTRRLALVTTVPFNKKTYGGNGDAARTLHICEQLVDDRDDMVVKAMSWALRELVRWDREAVEDFLTVQHLAPRVIREVRKKLETGRKNG